MLRPSHVPLERQFHSAWSPGCRAGGRCRLYDLGEVAGGDTELGVYLILGAIAAILVWPTGILARWAATCFYTPRGERRYWRASTAKQYQEMRSEGCQMTLDYRRNAFQFLKAEQGA